MNVSALLIKVLLVSQAITHKCIHGQIAKDLGELPINKDPGSDFSDRQMQENDPWRKIRILFDFTHIVNASENAQKFIKDVMAPMVKADFEEMLEIRGPDTIFPFTQTACDNHFTVPNKYKDSNIDADLLIFVSLFNDSEKDILAFAAPCSVEGKYLRPNIGMVVINEHFFKINKPYVKNFHDTIKHEVFHILAISPNLYNSFNRERRAYIKESKSTTSGQTSVYKFISENLVDFAKEHFSCDTLDGVYLENEGSSDSAGAHFEKSLYGNEIMTSEKAGHSVLSGLSLAFLEDSGWYKVNYKVEEPLEYGKGNGCEFASHNCNTNYKEFCDVKGAVACSRDFIAKTICVQSNFGDSCLHEEYVEQYMCKNTYSFQSTAKYERSGGYSRCFETVYSSNKAAGCYQSACENGTIKLTIDDTVLTCTKKGDIIEYEDIEIICPDTTEFCSQLAKSCDEDCNGFGVCRLDETCYCDYFHSGSTCSNEVECDTDLGDLCDLLSKQPENSHSFIISFFAIYWTIFTIS